MVEGKVAFKIVGTKFRNRWMIRGRGEEWEDKVEAGLTHATQESYE